MNPDSNQNESKRGRGGKRPGAGRKKGAIVAVPKTSESIASIVLSSVNEKEIWKRLLNSESDKICIEAMKYLTDRRDGKAKETHEVVATHTITLSEDDKAAAQSIIARLKG